MKLAEFPLNPGSYTGGPCMFFAAIDTGATRTLCHADSLKHYVANGSHAKSKVLSCSTVK